MVMAPIDVRCPVPGKPFPGGPRPLPFPQPGPKPFPIHPIHPIDPAMMDKLAFQMKDRNNDGQLSLDEWVRSKGDREITMKDVNDFKRYDTNDDGVVDQDEFKKGRAFDRFFRDGITSIKDGWKQHVVPLGEKFFNAKPAAAETK